MNIHRCRFVPYPPSTINVLAFSHSQTNGQEGTDNVRLAIGRANGDVEIWNPLNGSWLQETIFRGGKDRSIDGLVWIQDPDEEDVSGRTIQGRLRLFSTGYTTTVTEWDFEKGQPLRQSSGNHGEIWCLTAQPSLLQSKKQTKTTLTTGQWRGQNLVTGCIDGAVVLYSTADDDLKLQRILVRPSTKKAKVISINFQDRNTVIAGCTDSNIRVYDIRNATLIRSISLGASPSGGPKEIIVWAVKCLPNGNIISGDSTGEVRIWDGKTYTLVQRLKSHMQDVLSLATSSDGSTILSGGMDRRTVVYKQVGGTRTRWAGVTHKRFHSHDVKTMATFEGNGLSIVASGGPDSSPIIVPLREFGMENQRTLPCLPQKSVLQAAPNKRLLMSWWDREVHIWRIKKPSASTITIAESATECEQPSQNRKLIAKILLKGEASITSACIAESGNLLAISTTAEVKLFRLKLRDTNDVETLGVSKLDMPERLAVGGAKLVQFSPDGLWLCTVQKDNRVLIARVLTTDNMTPSFQISPVLTKPNRLDRKVDKHILLGGLGGYERTIAHAAFSSDSRILAVSDLAGYIDTWVLEGHQDLGGSTRDQVVVDDAVSSSNSDESDSDEDESTPIVLGQRWIRNPSASLIPKSPAAPVVLSFRPANLIHHASKANGILTAHPTRRNPHPHSHDLPDGESRLLVVTATLKILEFDVLRGSLTAWSRSNPMTKFPEEFKGLRDQAMGCIWDIQDTRERLWLYGTKWLWMFDLSRNLPSKEVKVKDEGHLANSVIHNGTAGERKRKRGFEKAVASGNQGRWTSGAGSRIPDAKLGIGMSRIMRSVVHDELDEVRQIRQDYHHDMDLDDDEDDEDGEIGTKKLNSTSMSALDRLRSAADAATNGEGKDDDNDTPHWWHTYKYRPIMGIVPVGNENIEGESSRGPEVAVVERPEWELGLPPRYYGEQEWEKPGL